MKRNSVHFLSPLLSLSLFFPPSKKKRHRLKRERESSNGDKKLHGVPCDLVPENAGYDEKHGLPGFCPERVQQNQFG